MTTIPQEAIGKRMLSELQNLRDEARVRIHLTGLEARQRWEHIEAQLASAEIDLQRGGERAVHNAASAVLALSASFRDLLTAAIPQSDDSTKVSRLMQVSVFTCSAEDTLEHAAKLMWDADCGSIPVIDAHRQLEGMITDRDICMAAYTQGVSLSSARVSSCMARRIWTCSPDNTALEALRFIAGYRVRRLPVTDANGVLVGIITLGDIARHFRTRGTAIGSNLAQAEVANTLAEVSEPPQAPSASAE